MPLVSVVMNCLDAERYLKEAIDSVYAQTCGDWEILLVDNGSKDSSARIAQTYDGRLRYLRNEQTVPLGAARNQALLAARGEFVCFLDCDDRWVPDKLEQQLAFFDDHSRVDFLHGNFYYIDARGRRTATGYRKEQASGRVFGYLLRYLVINLQTVMIRRSALDRLDELFDPMLSLGEDYDLFMRLAHDSEFGYLHQPLAEYRLHAGQASVRFPERYGEEMEYCVNKLTRRFADLETRYPVELNYLQGKIAYWKARAAMARNDSAAARALLAPHRGKSWHFRALHALTYFGPGLWNGLHQLRLRIGSPA
jgi:glycosyltransferase involved in cell wall biosynthesis